jgi:hypothetical protein
VWLIANIDATVEELYSKAESEEEYEVISELETLCKLVREIFQNDSSANASAEAEVKGPRCEVIDRLVDSKQSSGTSYVAGAKFSSPLIMPSREVMAK